MSGDPDWQPKQYWDESTRWCFEPSIRAGPANRQPGDPLPIVVHKSATLVVHGDMPIKLPEPDEFPGVEDDAYRQWLDLLPEKLPGLTLQNKGIAQDDHEFYAIGGSVMLRYYNNGKASSPQGYSFAYIFSPADRSLIREKTGDLSIYFSGILADLQLRTVVPVRDALRAYIPNGLVRLKIDNSTLILRETEYALISGSWGHQSEEPDVMVPHHTPPFQIIVLVDPVLHQAFILEEKRREISRWIYNSCDRVCFESQLDSPKGISLDGKLLYIFEVTPTGRFESTISKPNVTVHPVESERVEE